MSRLFTTPQKVILQQVSSEKENNWKHVSDDSEKREGDMIVFQSEMQPSGLPSSDVKAYFHSLKFSFGTNKLQA